ncbi:hypothetical protein KC338_g81 [Hortaea werneckii]|nr:hypothetical protein KC338_g81 [Hortaea werneckii]
MAFLFCALSAAICSSRVPPPISCEARREPGACGPHALLCVLENSSFRKLLSGFFVRRTPCSSTSSPSSRPEMRRLVRGRREEEGVELVRTLLAFIAGHADYQSGMGVVHIPPSLPSGHSCLSQSTDYAPSANEVAVGFRHRLTGICLSVLLLYWRYCPPEAIRECWFLCTLASPNHPERLRSVTRSQWTAIGNGLANDVGIEGRQTHTLMLTILSAVPWLHWHGK